MVKLSVQQGTPDLDKRSVKALLTLLCVLFIAAQTVGLSHSHEGGLSLQADCDVCLKLTSDDDLIVASDSTKFGAPVAIETEFSSTSWIFQCYFRAQARAPPLA